MDRNRAATKPGRSRCPTLTVHLALFVRKTNTGKLVASFPLATRTVDKKAVWTKIVAFDKRAEALKECVAKGQHVQVAGYRHVTDRKLKDGSTKQVEEVYAVHVKPIGSREDRGQSPIKPKDVIQ